MFRNPLGYCTALDGSAIGASLTLNGCLERGKAGRESAASPPLNERSLHQLRSEGVSALSAVVWGVLPGSSEDPPAVAAAAAEVEEGVGEGYVPVSLVSAVDLG